MTKVIAVSIMNSNNYQLKDLPDELVSKSVIIACIAQEEYVKSEISSILAKSKSSFVLNMEDTDESYEDVAGKYPVNTQEQINKMYGIAKGTPDLIIPNQPDIDILRKYISDNLGEDFIVCCSAGKARTGAIVEYLLSKGYSLDGNYNTKFTPNKQILVMLNTD